MPSIRSFAPLDLHICLLHSQCRRTLQWNPWQSCTCRQRTRCTTCPCWSPSCTARQSKPCTSPRTHVVRLHMTQLQYSSRGKCGGDPTGRWRRRTWRKIHEVGNSTIGRCLRCMSCPEVVGRHRNNNIPLWRPVCRTPQMPNTPQPRTMRWPAQSRRRRTACRRCCTPSCTSPSRQSP